jgi:hypothetical protein
MNLPMKSHLLSAARNEHDVLYVITSSFTLPFVYFEKNIQLLYLSKLFAPVYIERNIHVFYIPDSEPVTNAFAYHLLPTL